MSGLALFPFVGLSSSVAVDHFRKTALSGGFDYSYVRTAPRLAVDMFYSKCISNVVPYMSTRMAATVTTIPTVTSTFSAILSDLMRYFPMMIFRFLSSFMMDYPFYLW